MTYREWMMENHPECVGEKYVGGCSLCPNVYFENADCCLDGTSGHEKCKECWDQEIPSEAVPLESAEIVKSKRAVPYEEEAENADCAVDGKTGMTRTEILDTAKQMVCGQREMDYGSPEDSFHAIADLWQAYLDTKITTKDVAVMMCLFKIARIKTGTGTADSFVDLCGYAACGGEIALGSDIDAQTMAEL